MCVTRWRAGSVTDYAGISRTEEQDWHSSTQAYAITAMLQLLRSDVQAV